MKKFICILLITMMSLSMVSCSTITLANSNTPLKTTYTKEYSIPDALPIQNNVNDPTSLTFETLASNKSVPNMASQSTEYSISSKYRNKLNDMAKDQAAPYESYYKNEKVLELHSLNGDSNTYQNITGKFDFSNIIDKLDGYDAKNNSTGNYGFLVITEKGKYDIRLNDVKNASKSTKQLITLCKEANKKYTSHAQWLSFMSTSNITGITYRGQTGIAAIKNNKTYTVSLESTNSATLKKVSNALKNLPISSFSKSLDTSVNPSLTPDGGWMEITFKGDIKYLIAFSGKSIFVYTSDLDYTLIYNCTEDNMMSFYDFMLILDESKLSELA